MGNVVPLFRKPIYTGNPLAADLTPILIREEPVPYTQFESEMVSAAFKAIDAMMDYTARHDASQELVNRVEALVKMARYRIDCIQRTRAGE